MRALRRFAVSLVFIAAILTAVALLLSHHGGADSMRGWSPAASDASFKQKVFLSAHGLAAPMRGSVVSPEKGGLSAHALAAPMGGSVVSPEKRSRGPRALLRGGIPTPAEARQKMAAEHDAIKKRKVSEIVEGSAAAAPPPPPNPTEQKLTIRLLSIIGCILTVLVYCNTIIVLWSTGNIASTIAFCKIIDLITSAMGTAAWLLFSVIQLHGQDGRITGIEVVITNSIGLTLTGVFITVKLAAGGNMSLQVCLGTLISFATIIGMSLGLALFLPIMRESSTAQFLSTLAAILQTISQLIPFYSAYQLAFPVAGAQEVVIMNMRPLIVHSRTSNFAIYLYWAMYAVLTYQHTVFEVTNIVSCVLCFVSLCLHLTYALRPTPEENAAAEDDPEHQD